MVRVRHVLSSKRSSSDPELPDEPTLEIAAEQFSQSSLSQVLIPMCWSPLVSDEYQKKEQQGYVAECVALLGVVCEHLTWSHYYRTIRGVLRKLDNVTPDSERILLSTLVATVEGFHFDLKDSEQQAPVDSNAQLGVEAQPDDDGEAAQELDELHDEGEQQTVLPAAKSSMSLSDTVTRSLIPWIRKFLLKESKDR